MIFFLSIELFLNMHVQLSSGTTGLNFDLSLQWGPHFVCVSIESSDETVNIHTLVSPFAARICN